MQSCKKEKPVVEILQYEMSEGTSVFLGVSRSRKVGSERKTSVENSLNTLISSFLFTLYTTSQFFISLFVFFLFLSPIYCWPGAVYSKLNSAGGI